MQRGKNPSMLSRVIAKNVGDVFFETVYIKVPYFTSFRFGASSIVGLGLGLVVGLGSVLVLFFYCIFPFQCMLKDRKLQPAQVPPP